ncbi:hypothetical protein MOK15_21605 [Sphingobium sp. BYY-5]|uniref:hypothetical protein n=1 Tax=Sphingobium sp. BYY-5 TaxID=2926400 RepID=UPI001FA768F7|nr:hypothetical protein [Sphingobium sp. BYY-5]MCI4592657.1 hypothetical protein [Sphingobium sp. BYY-5]
MRSDISPAAPSTPLTQIQGDDGEIYLARSGRRIAGINASHVGNGLLRVASPVDKLILEDARVNDVYRVIENKAAEKDGDASIHGLRVSRVLATGIRRSFARIGYDSRDGIIEDVLATGTTVTAPHDLPVGIGFTGTAHDFRIERCIMRGFRWQRGEKKYWNGDGYSAERGNYRLLFRRCAAYDNSDGGFDLKSSTTVLDDCIAGGNARNYRLWTSMRATRLTSLEPVKAGGIGDTCHFSLMGEKSVSGKTAEPITIHIEHLEVRSSKGWPIFVVHDGPVRISIGTHDIQVPPQTPLVRLAGGAIPGGIVWQSGPPRGLTL